MLMSYLVSDALYKFARYCTVFAQRHKNVLEINNHADSHIASLQKVCIHLQATEQHYTSRHYFKNGLDRMNFKL